MPFKARRVSVVRRTKIGDQKDRQQRANIAIDNDRQNYCQPRSAIRAWLHQLYHSLTLHFRLAQWSKYRRFTWWPQRIATLDEN
jgi:hypothetical protein